MLETDTLPPRIQTLIETIQAAEELTPASTGEILTQADVSAEDLEPWADWDHPVADSYGRNLVFDGGYFELMVMSWLPSDMAAIHDHGHTQWGALRLFGDAEHATFRVEGDQMITGDRRIFPAGTTVNVGHELLHQMGNTGDERFLSLHLYGCYGRDGGVTSEARLYELDKGLVQRVDGGVFFALPENEVLAAEPGPTPDFTTRLRDRAELLRRLLKVSGTMADSSRLTPRERSLIDRMFGADGAAEAIEGLSGWIEGRPENGSKPEVVVADLQSVIALRNDLVVAGLLDGETADRHALAADGPARLAGTFLDLVGALAAV